MICKYKSAQLHIFHLPGELDSTSTGSHMMVKKYKTSGYEIGLYYAMDNFSGRPAITHVWKRLII